MVDSPEPLSPREPEQARPVVIETLTVGAGKFV